MNWRLRRYYEMTSKRYTGWPVRLFLQDARLSMPKRLWILIRQEVGYPS